MLIEEFKIREMTDEDIDAILLIEKDSFKSPWNRNHFLFEIKSNSLSINGVGLLNNAVIGYVMAWTIMNELHINNIAVRKDLRERGFGTQLLSWILKKGMEKRIECAMLEVRENNISAINLYKKLGFIECGRRKKYYADDGSDAILFYKDIKVDKI
ncbi:MAG: ribosomal protein S18-alanine N-acetyltransferase [Candidatus Hydrogenedentota bacterium]